MTTTLDWYGCATFGLQTAGLNIMLDAYIDRAANAAGPSPARSASDIAECDYLVVGHAHFDHLFGAEVIMANTKATLIGSYETVRVMEGLGVPLDRMLPVAGGETIELEGATGRATVSVYPSQHRWASPTRCVSVTSVLAIRSSGNGSPSSPNISAQHLISALSST
jgi:L-ascorbate metabolism protein UlaG (beta-lactamase superfamily)